MSHNFKRKTTVPVNRTCYLKIKPNEFLGGAFNPKVSIETLKILENPNFHNSTFIFRNGEIKLEENRHLQLKRKTFKFCLLLLILLVLSLLHREIYSCLSHDFLKNYSLVLNKSSFLGNLKKEITSNLNEEITSNLYNENELIVKTDQAKVTKNSIQITKSEDFLIKSITRDLFIEAQKEYILNSVKTSCRPFIEEQCHNVPKKHNFAGISSGNDTLLDLTTDYALESQGAKIISIFNTDQYGILAVKFVNFILHPGLSEFLMKYFKIFSSKGPTSILIPWKKPGDCWAFKGQKGRVQIQLSEPIIIYGVTIDHIPKQLALDGDIYSAPKEFFILGVKKMKEDVRKILLGKFEFSNKESASQTFFIQPKSNLFFEIVEIGFESNHGNEVYTCVYKVRIHGQK